MKRFNVIHKLIKDIPNPVGAEIGVCDGPFSEFLLKHNPSLKMYAIDPWVLYRKHYVGDTGAAQHGFSTQQEFDDQYKAVKARLARFGNRCIILRKTSIEASKEIKDLSLDFVFIDANHLYSYVKQDILTYYSKVKKDGIVSGHDYNPKDENHMINTCKAVNQIFYERELNTGSDSTWWVIKGQRK